MKCILILFTAFTTSCATFSSVDRSYVSSKSLDFDKSFTLGRKNHLTTLGSINDRSSGAGCTSCAK